MRETCGNCDGYGLVSDYGDGQDFYGAKECPRCGGSGTVQPRDQRGRFRSELTAKDGEAP